MKLRLYSNKFKKTCIIFSSFHIFLFENNAKIRKNLLFFTNLLLKLANILYSVTGFYAGNQSINLYIEMQDSKYFFWLTEICEWMIWIWYCYFVWSSYNNISKGRCSGLGECLSVYRIIYNLFLYISIRSSYVIHMTCMLHDSLSGRKIMHFYYISFYRLLQGLNRFQLLIIVTVIWNIITLFYLFEWFELNLNFLYLENSIIMVKDKISFKIINK